MVYLNTINTRFKKNLMRMEYEDAFKKSLKIFQFECNSYKCKGKRWWGSMMNQICKNCMETAKKLKLEETIGIGWFKCKCGRRYAGFSRGDVASACHGCKMENYPEFIVSGDRASHEEKSTDKKHNCAECEGGYHCPIVEEARRINGLKRKDFKNYF